jgi:adenine modification enzyme
MGKLKKTPIKDWTDYIVGFECKKKDIKIMMCEKDQADSIIAANHYSKKPTKNSFLNLLVYYNDKISGALQIGYGIRPEINGDFNKGEVVEFDRMWLSDEMPKFSETITLSLLNHFLKSRYKNLKAIISYSDTSVGNEGTIYKAGNYKLINTLKADFYITEDGERVHPVTMWHRHKTRSWEFLQKKYPNIKKADGKQLKYIYYLK